jgi:hypothetical protein
METSLQRVLCILITFCVALSCSDKKQDKPKILDKITALPEFKRESNRIDSLKATGRKVDLQIVVVSDSFYPEDSVKNISIVLIEEDLGFDQIPLFEVKFDKTTEEIISISDNANSNGPSIEL